ncbi:uncharacterized protein B0J16DRAFT_314785 [Fusarium flagelliforme]|uniref:uncharacterized protein n=1 Tax=Fusarium flagelliforme TaxID=2675880 RepID=UPI001E8E7BB3|nr:uncharacterized protein B0J16DRAFT_314785 [Fusarium flagelliforme]KAH7198477.1 hypothetical protein B0J16DRAFT_314785 [Fusarium flagelliforme]
MKYSVAFVALAAAAAQAQSLADVPKCAIPCLDKAIESKTKCETTDLACICESFDEVRSSATSCVIDECGSDVAINEVLPATEGLCKDPPKEESKKEESTSVKVVVSTSVEAVETTAAATTTVAPIVPTTVVEATHSTPVATPTKGSGGQEPAPTEVGQNSASGIKGLGALAMAAFAALAL